MKKLLILHKKKIYIVLIILALLYLAGMAINLYWQDRVNQIAKQEELQNIITNQQQELNNTKERVENIQKQTTKNQNNTQKSTTENSYASLVNQWEDEVAYIECDFLDRNTGEVLLTQTGSGYYMGGDGIYSVFTNLHIAKVDNPDGSGGYKGASYCYVKLLNDTESVLIPRENIKAPNTYGADVALLEISNPTQYMVKKPFEVHKSCRRPEDNFSGGVDIGDKIIILGYPGIGSQTGITVTEGIISGIDFPYYITSAKIEHGNSGGVAVLVKNGCHLGIPTSVAGGELESLGRVYDVVQAMVELFYDINP